MLQISTDISSLNQDEREQLAGFILTFGLNKSERDQRLLKFAEGSTASELEKAMRGAFDQKMAEVVEMAAATDEPLPFELKPPTELSATEVTAFTPVQPNPADVFAIEPAAPGPTLVPNPPSADNLDKSGLPWDERIHASTKALTADGMWRRKRGVTDSLVTDVETELRKLAPSLPAPPPPAAAAPPPPPPPTIDRAKFVGIVRIVSAAIAAKKITNEEFVALLPPGVTSLQDLGVHPEHWETVAADADTMIASRG